MKALRFIIEIIKKYPRQFFITVILLLVLNFFEIGTTLSLAPLVDLITANNFNNANSAITLKIFKFFQIIKLAPTVYNVLFLVLLFALLKAFFSILVNFSLLRTKYFLLRDMICGTYANFFSARWNFFVGHSQGMLGNTFIKEINKIGESYTRMSRIFVAVFQTALYFLVAFFISWKLSLIVLVLSLVLAFLFSLLGKINYNLGKKDVATANRIFEIISESLSAAKLILGFGEQKKSQDALGKAVDTHLGVTIKAQLLDIGTPILFQPFGFAIILFSLFLSFTVIKVPVAELTIVLYSFYCAIPFVGQIMATKNTLLNFFPSYEQIKELQLAAKNEIQPSGTSVFDQFQDKIIFENVNFAYHKNLALLKNINLVIPKGKTIAFVGRSGAGKTTLIDLLFRFFEPDSGRITVDGIGLGDIEVRSWRKKIGYVPQESFLFNTAILENLKWANENATEEEIWEACKVANAEEFITQLPRQLETLVGDRGVRLSGGQRQRLCLARAILRKPQLLILDEATSSLDSESEKLIQQAIENIAAKTTVIVIAHRLATVTKADNIYIVEDGMIIEEGSFCELCLKKGKFYEFAKTQGIV